MPYVFSCLSSTVFRLDVSQGPFQSTDPNIVLVVFVQ
jgi:hypothetical protein